MARTSATPKRVVWLFSQKELVVRHYEYHVVYVPEDAACLGAIIENDTIVTVLPDHQITWQLPKLVAKQRYGLHVVHDNARTHITERRRTTSILIEVIAASGTKQTVVFTSTCFGFTEEWFGYRWFLETLADAITYARDELPEISSISVIYRGRGIKEYAPPWMIMELLGKSL
ncbi:MAG: hypothetical protein KBD21_00725 [Candidatus Pacebacteria bacterium]|nr:hypothetical protein [Candidatus Paceibacterota bacterium]